MRGLGYMVAAAWIGIGLIELPLEAQAPVRTEWTQAAESFIRKLEANDFAAAAALVGPRMVQAGVTSQMLEQTWRQLTAAGSLRELKLEAVTESGGFHVVDLVATFGDTARLRLRVSLDAEKRVEGWRLFPVEAPRQFAPPPYARLEAFEELELTVGAEGWPLGATLTLPKGVARAPVVVLVHGSGAHDRDETLLGNKPFRDLAHGLATQGIGVLRYEKRNWKHAARMVSAGAFTVEDEVIADALAALSQVRGHPRVDASRVYLLGHSLGGMLAPEIAARDGKLAGVILLAGSPRQLTQLVLEQIAYIRALPGSESAEAQAQFTAIVTQMERLRKHEIPAAEMAMGAPASYFYDLERRDALAFLAQVKAPLLVLQGGRDYQVTEKDYDMYRTALAGRKNAVFRLYPELNHLFMAGTGKATPQEYTTLVGHVDVRVLNDIASFVKGAAK